MNIAYSTSKITFTVFCCLSSLIFLSACSKKEELPQARMLPIAGIAATGPYFTQDHLDRPVLCWTEKDKKDSLYRLKYAVYDQLKDTLGVTVTVSGSAGCSTSAESMGKIAFKSDGTAIAIFAKSFPLEKNPYAGAIYYSMSKDEGQNWSEPRFLHSDTSHAYGRSFFDITRLKSGEIAAIWLDGRFAGQIKGSSLFFSKTEAGAGFETEICLDKGTCECCRTNILTDQEGNIHLAYRGIQYPSVLSGKQVRDMVYRRSSDQGKSFLTAQAISRDNWEMEGCPHSGPSLSVTGDQVQAIWFTAGGGAGLYTAAASAKGGGFQERQLVTASGRHPQMIAVSAGRTAMVCEEVKEDQSNNRHLHEKTDHSKMNHSMMKPAPAAPAKIVLSILDKGKAGKSTDISDGRYADHHAVLRLVDHELIIAWVREEASGSSIYYTNMHLSDQ